MPSPGAPSRYRFGPFEFELDQRRLLRAGAAIGLRPRSFDLLAALVERAGIPVQSESYPSQPGPFLALAATQVKVDDIVLIPGSGRSQVMRVLNDVLVPFQI
jgi:hypothetical protein